LTFTRADQEVMIRRQ